MAKALDRQVGGGHYKDLTIQPIEFIVEHGLGYHQGNVLKYVTRYRFKNGKQDLRKALHYVELMLSQATAGRLNGAATVPAAAVAEYCKANKLPPAEATLLEYVCRNSPHAWAVAQPLLESILADCDPMVPPGCTRCDRLTADVVVAIHRLEDIQTYAAVKNYPLPPSTTAALDNTIRRLRGDIHGGGGE